MSRADRDWFARAAPDVARALIGQVLVHFGAFGRLSGRIVETEAYLGLDDAASHASLYRHGFDKLSRDPGIVYMYRAYGIHAMFNIVTDSPGTGGAVLIRALEPLEGIETMRERRGPVPDRSLTRGPGNVCQAMGFRLDLDGHDLVSSHEIFVETCDAPVAIECSPRIGITKNPDPLLRYYDRESPFVSGSRTFKTGMISRGPDADPSTDS
jgi:DNA-3-methyladenine glycosylase